MIHYYNCQAFIILLHFAVPFYHFLFSRYLDLTKCHFSSDILVPFPDLSNLYSHVTTQGGHLQNVWFVSLYFKISKTTSLLLSIIFFHFLNILNFFIPGPGETKKGKRLAVICFVIQDHKPHYKLKKPPMEQYFIKLTCRLSFYIR